MELCYTLNEANIRLLFKKYCSEGRNQLVLEDVDRMFIKDTQMPITKDMLLEVYGMCQMTVV